MELCNYQGDLVHFELLQMASALNKAEEMQRHRSDYFDSLYDDIRLSTIPFGDYITEERGANVSTASQALEIIDRKNAYNKAMKRLYVRHDEWCNFLKAFSDSEGELLKRHFEHGENISTSAFNKVVQKATVKLNSINQTKGVKLDKQAIDYYSELCKKFPYLRTKPKKNAEEYLMNGKFVEATEEEYKAYTEEQRQMDRALDKKLLRLGVRFS